MTTFDIEAFYDGHCLLCLRDVRLLRRLDGRERTRFVDTAHEAFDAGSVGVTLEVLMDRIHGRLPDGTLVEGVEVFRRLYTAAGFGVLVAPTPLPGIAHVLDLGYRFDRVIAVLPWQHILVFRRGGEARVAPATRR